MYLPTLTYHHRNMHILRFAMMICGHCLCSYGRICAQLHTAIISYMLVLLLFVSIIAPSFGQHGFKTEHVDENSR